MNILNKDWNYKVQHLLYIEYGLDSDLEDDIHYDILSISHGKFFKIHIDENDDGQKQYCEEIKNTKKLVEDYHFLKYKYIKYQMIDQIFEVNDIQPYHKMHFDIKSEDGTYGLILFKQKMIEISQYDIEDILYDCLNNPIDEIKEMYKHQEKQLNEWFEKFTDEYERDDNDEYDL